MMLTLNNQCLMMAVQWPMMSNDGLPVVIEDDKNGDDAGDDGR